MRQIYPKSGEAIKDIATRASNLAFQVNEKVRFVYNGIESVVFPESFVDDITYIHGLKWQIRVLSKNYKYE